MIKTNGQPSEEALRNIIGSRVASLRIERERAEGKFSQYDLAAALREYGYPIQQSQIGHIESGRRFPSVELLYAIAELFDTSMDYLTGRTDNATSLAAIQEDLQTGGVSGRLADIYKLLPEEGREEVYQLADALLLIQKRHCSASLPTPQQRGRANILRALDSVERNIGKDVRDQLADMIRLRFKIDEDNS